MKTLIKSFGIFTALFFSIGAFSQTLSSSLTADTPAYVATGKAKITSLYVINSSSSNTMTLSLYDAASTNLLVIRPAYTNVISYATNYSVTSTNGDGILSTNTFSGWYTAYALQSAATNSRTALLSYIIPAATVRTIPLSAYVSQGLTLNPANAGGTVEVTYSPNP